MAAELEQGLAQLWLQARDGTLPVLPGRTCGACVTCCVNTSIDTPQIQKLSGARCRNLCDGGCAIHASRPPVCRDFFCAWRQLPFLDEDWRPDRSGVMLKLFVTDGVTGLSLLLTGDPQRTVRRPWFIAFVMAAFRTGVPIWLAIDGPRGHDGAQRLLNSQEMAAALASSKGAQARVRDELQRVLAQLQGFAFQPGVFAHRGQDVSMP
jgi:hypothetical protein